jgi:hypothetical protein
MNKGPFKNPLEKGKISEESSNLYEIEGDSGKKIDKVVRKIDWLDKTLKEIPDSVNKVVIIKRLFEELKSYGIDSPVDWVLADALKEDKHQGPTLYAFTDKIEGVNLEDVSVEKKAEVAKEVEKIVEGWVDYFSEKLKSGDYFLWDITRGRQYMYGHRETDKENKIYMVDTDPLISNDSGELFFSLVTLAISTPSLENIFNTKFVKAREKLNQLIGEFENNPKFSNEKYNFEKAKKILNI